MELKDLIEKLQKEWAAFKEKHETELAEVKSRGEATGETKAWREAISNTVAELDKQVARIVTIPTSGTGKSEEEVRAIAHKAAVNTWLRKGGPGPGAMAAAGIKPEEIKLLSTDDDTSAGVFVSPVTEAGVLRRLVEESPIRALARVTPISRGDALEIVRRNTTRHTINKVGERTSTRVEDGPAKLYEKLRIPVHLLDSNPGITEVAIEDAQMDLEAELMGDVQLDFAVKEGQWFISGTGVDEAEGLLTSSEITAVNGGHASAIDFTSLAKLVTQLPSPYAQRATLVFNRKSTLFTILTLQDQNDQYIYQPATAAGVPSTVWGYPWREAVDMPDVAANAYPILFGDFQRGYRIVDRRGLRVVRDQLTQYPFTVFKVSRRVGGRVVLGEAIRKLKVAA